MKKKLLLCILLKTIILNSLFSQSIRGFQLEVTSSNYYPVEFLDPQGVVIGRGKIDRADGDPYYRDEWQKATIITTSGSVMENVFIKMHLQANKVYYKKDSVEIIEIDKGIVDRVIFTNGNDTTVFGNGFPSINKKNEHTFYKIVAEGKYTFLNLLEKFLIQNKNDMSGEISNEFRLYSSYFINYNDTMISFNPKKDIKKIENIISNKDLEKYNKFIADKKQPLKTVEDIKVLLDYLNKN
jgi:hypothetical protein